MCRAWTSPRPTIHTCVSASTDAITMTTLLSTGRAACWPTPSTRHTDAFTSTTTNDGPTELYTVGDVTFDNIKCEGMGKMRACGDAGFCGPAFYHSPPYCRLVAWRSCGFVRRMSEVILRWLVLGWVTVFGRVYHLDMYIPTN